MDPIFYPTSSGLPSESKLTTYMTRPASPTFGLMPCFSLLNLETPLAVKKTSTQGTAHNADFIPETLNTISPVFYPPFHQNLMDMNNVAPTANGVIHHMASNMNSDTNGGVPSTAPGVQCVPTDAMKNLLISSPTAQHISTPVTVSKPLNGISTPQSLIQQKVTEALATQQKQQQQQQQQQLVSGQISTPLGMQNYLHNGQLNNLRRNLLRESPHGLLKENLPVSPICSPEPSPCLPNMLPASVHQENVGGTVYFYPTTNANPANGQNTTIVNSAVDASAAVAHGHRRSGHGHSASTTAVAPMTPLPTGLLYSGHVYPGPASHIITMQPKSQLETAFFIPEEMRAEILTRNEISNMILEPMEAAQHSLPIEVDSYHSLYPLEPMTPMHGKIVMLSSTYRATHARTGIKYCLRRLHGFRLQSTKCLILVDMWKKLNHSNLAQLREVFTTKAFGDKSLVLVYDYFPGSQTLLSKYFTPIGDSNGYTDPFQGDARPFSHKSNLTRTSNGPLMSEATIWAIIMQLTAGLRAMHQAGLACRQLDPTKIILTGKRARFSFCGVTDITNFDPSTTNPQTIVNCHQQEDLTALGRLVLALACRCLNAVQRDNVQLSIDLVARHYSADLRNFIVYLFTTTQRRSVTDLMPMIGARFYTQLEALQSQCDVQEDELSKEMENGRLYRILVKLNYINERPDFNMDVTWSETGDRYMLKLFRDYLFHSVTEDGRPWLDHAHVIHCLNKLDAGCNERVQLMSRDEQSLLIVTYAELKNCLENSFAELMANAA